MLEIIHTLVLLIMSLNSKFIIKVRNIDFLCWILLEVWHFPYLTLQSSYFQVYKKIFWSEMRALWLRDKRKVDILGTFWTVPHPPPPPQKNPLELW